MSYPSGRIVAVCTSAAKGERKVNVEHGDLIKNFGLSGDAHASGEWHRQVSLLALDRCELVLLVMEPTLVGLKAAKRLVALSEQLGHGPEKIAPVVNRADAKGSVPAGEVKRVLDRKVAAWLPNDSKSIMEAGNAGRPVLRDRPRVSWSKTVIKLADGLMKSWGGEE